MNILFNFERYSTAGVAFGIFFISFSTIFAILLREAKNENSNWSAPVWFADIVIGVMSLFAGSIILRIWEVSTSLYMIPGPWVLIPVAILGWITTFLIHAITKKIAPEKLKIITLKIFS